MIYYLILESIDTSVTYINSTHGKRQLVLDGARFCIKQKNLNSILWRCTKTNCPASVTVSNNDIILRKNGLHNHFIEPNEIKVLELRENLKKDAQSTSTPIDRIVETGYANMVIENKIIDSVAKIPSIRT